MPTEPITAGTITPSTSSGGVATDSRKNRLYLAFRELNVAVRTRPSTSSSATGATLYHPNGAPHARHRDDADLPRDWLRRAGLPHGGCKTEPSMTSSSGWALGGGG